jgi:aminoglycoside phosphotransferase (APT) family kinase protein
VLVLDSPPAPCDLTRINQLLVTLGLGILTPAATTTVPGRNHNRVGVTDRGIGVFVKHIGGTPDSAARLRRVIAIETAHRDTRDQLPRPRCLGWDEASGLVVFELLRQARSGSQLAEDGAFDDDLAARAGRLVARLHDSPVMARCADPAAPPFPATHALEALSWHELRTATGAELELWRILQQDRNLGAAVRGLGGGAHPTGPAHCDLRLDQFQLSGGRLYLSDWEELRLADPARDVGAFAGEWLFRSITGLTGEAGLSHADIVERAVLAFERVRPRITAFWRGYLATSAEPDAELPCRATAFAGWHQFDRLFAVAAERPRLGPVERAVAGIARRALLAPDEFAAALGLRSRP